VITLAVMPHNLVFQGIEFLLPKLYINSYLAMLNARRSLKDHAVTINPPSKMIQFNDSETRHLTSHDSQGRTMVDEPNIPSSSRAVKVKVDVVRDQGNRDYVNANLSEKSHPAVTYAKKDSRF